MAGTCEDFFWSYRKREAHECIQGDCPADADQPDYGLGGMECRFVRMEDDFILAKESELTKGKEELQVDMGLCLYVIQEEYRPKIKEAHRKFFAFLESNEKFISLVTDGNETIITAEGLLQVQRMSYLTSVHYQGCRFFRREREE